MVTDLLAFQTRCQRYVALKRVPAEVAEDLVQEMVCHALTHPALHVAVEVAYLRAMDRVNPRHVINGQRLRVHLLSSSLEAPLASDDDTTFLEGLTDATVKPARQRAHSTRHREPDQSLTDYADTLPPAGRTRAIRLLHELYGYTQQEVGYLFGVNESRISQILTAAREAAEAQAPPRVQVVGPFQWEVRWIRF